MSNSKKQFHQQIMQYALSKWINKPMYVAAELGIADILSEGPISIEELAQLTKTHKHSLYRLMRALSGLGIFSESDNRDFQLTPMGELLKDDALRPIVQMFNSDWHDKAWGKLANSIRTGKNAFVNAHKVPIMKWLESNPEAAEIFNKANMIKSTMSAKLINQIYDFSAYKSVADIGGGYGGLLLEILKSNPNLFGSILDLPYVKNGAEKNIRNFDLENNCSFIECDFFKEITVDSDIYMLSNILHDWNDERCKIILENCYQAMNSKSRILIVEHIVPTGNEFSISKLLDLEMFVIGDGQERTEQEYRDLLEKSDFKISKIYSEGDNISIIEASVS